MLENRERTFFLKCIMILCLAFGILLPNLIFAEKVQAATVYYVDATNGNDTNNGTSTSLAFRTIQKCASVAVAGDTCYVRGGTYRETVSPVNSGTSLAPITFTPYNNESVTISGADKISGWSVYNGAIYQSAQMTWNLGLGNNQIFVNGVMVNEARWPHMGAFDDPSHPTNATVGSGSVSGSSPGIASGTINDSNLGSGYVGAKINIGAAKSWVMLTGDVTSSSSGTLTFNFYRQSDYIAPDAGQNYFLWGKLSLLGAPNETFYDSGSGLLYLWTPQGSNPSSQAVEAKRRQFAFDLSNRSYITVKGFNIFASSINTNNGSQYNVIDGINAKYVSHNMNMNTQADPFTFGVTNTGIILSGSNNTIKNSTIAYSSGNGIVLQGTNQVVNNNVIHDVDYDGGDTAAVHMGYSGVTPATSGHTVTYNTMYNSGRSILVFRSATATNISYNDLSRPGLQMHDLGIIYTFHTNGSGTLVGHNLVHDWVNGTGIYLDNYSSNYVVDHNVVWNTSIALALNTPSNNNKIYNNTFASSSLGVNVWGANGNTDMTGDELKNNIFTQPLNGVSSSAVQSNNIYSTTNPLFATNTYYLQSTSPAVDAGAVLSPYTNGYHGSAPDIGAYEYGNPPWTAGSNLFSRNPLQPISAEDYYTMKGIIDFGKTIGGINTGSWIEYNNVNFGSGVNKFQTSIAVDNAYAGKQLEIRLDSPTGTLIGTLTTQGTGGWGTYTTQSTSVSGVSGVHNLFLVGNGGYGVGNLDWFVFSNS